MGNHVSEATATMIGHAISIHPHHHTLMINLKIVGMKGGVASTISVKIKGLCVVVIRKMVIVRTSTAGLEILIIVVVVVVIKDTPGMIAKAGITNVEVVTTIAEMNMIGMKGMVAVTDMKM